MTSLANPTGTTAAEPTTHLPTYDEDAAPAVPRSALGKPTPDERFARIGSWVAGLGLAWVLTQRLLPLEGVPVRSICGRPVDTALRAESLVAAPDLLVVFDAAHRLQVCQG